MEVLKRVYFGTDINRLNGLISSGLFYKTQEYGHVRLTISTSYKSTSYIFEFRKVETRFDDEVRHRRWKL